MDKDNKIEDFVNLISNPKNISLFSYIRISRVNSKTDLPFRWMGLSKKSLFLDILDDILDDIFDEYLNIIVWERQGEDKKG